MKKKQARYNKTGNIDVACVNQFLQGCNPMTDECLLKIANNVSRPNVNRI